MSTVTSPPNGRGSTLWWYPSLEAPSHIERCTLVSRDRFKHHEGAARLVEGIALTEATLCGGLACRETFGPVWPPNGLGR